MPTPVGFPRLTVRPLVSECRRIPESCRPVSRATRPCPPSCAMVIALRESRHMRFGTTATRAAVAVTTTSHCSGADWVPKTRSQRSPRSVLSMVRAAPSGARGIGVHSTGGRGSLAFMCGRYAASRRPEDLTGLFGVEKWEPAETLEPDYNVAPTKEVYAVLERPVKDADDQRPVRQLRALKWGLVPSWSKSPEGGARMINARAETVHEKPSFRRPFVSRRCILPADGYYEWVTGADERQLEEKGKKKRPRKQPYFVTPAD